MTETKISKKLHPAPAYDEHYGQYWVLVDDDGHIYDGDDELAYVCRILNAKLDKENSNDD